MQLYREIHEGNGPYLLLVHGMLSGRAQWQINLPALKEFCRPVIVELWGHGRSPTPDDAALYRPEEYVHQFEALRESLNTNTWFVCGQSFGATMTIRYALDHPDRIKGHIFTNSMSAMSRGETARKMIDGAAKQAQSILERKTKLEDLHIHPRHAKRLPEDALKALLEDAQLLNPTGIAHCFQRSLAQATLGERFHETTVPTLLICGDAEKRFAPEREYAEQALPSLQVVRTPAGHAVNIGAPDQFNKAVANFIAAHN